MKEKIIKGDIKQKKLENASNIELLDKLIARLENKLYALDKNSDKINEYMEEIAILKEKRRTLKNTKGQHLCWDCVNAYASKCEKIRNGQKKHIDEYDFILCGYETKLKNGRVDDLHVSACENFVFEPNVKKNIENSGELKRALYMAYFDAETYKEAVDAEERLYRINNKQNNGNTEYPIQFGSNYQSDMDVYSVLLNKTLIRSNDQRAK